jgi:hypothetical protein
MSPEPAERLTRIASQIRSAADTLILARVALQTLGNSPDLHTFDRLTCVAAGVVLAEAVEHANNGAGHVAEMLAEPAAVS